MKERPILFSGPMVRAILDGRKTQTRRVMKPQPKGHLRGFIKRPLRSMKSPPVLRAWFSQHPTDNTDIEVTSPYGQPGGRLWLREEHYRYGHWEAVDGVRTRTGRQKWAFVRDSSEVRFDAPAEFRKGRHHKDPATPAWHKRLARFMQRSFARIELEIIGVRVERLHDISEADAKAEGIERVGGRYSCEPWKNYMEGRSCSAPSRSFQTLWESINGPESWDANPWVWVIEFRRVEK